MNRNALRRASGLAAVCALGSLATGAAPAPAANPTPCTGKYLGEDPAGDAFVGFVGLFETPIPAGANTDFTGVFVNSASTVTLNYRMADLNTTVPPDATAIGYRMNYDVGGTGNYLQVNIASAGTVTYSYGHSEDTGLVKDGDTKGAFFEGKDGVIQIEVPATHGGKAGTKWAGMSAFSAYVRGNVNTQTDQVPDGDATLAYNGATCPATSGGDPAPSGTPAPSGSPTPGSTPAPSSNPAPGPAATDPLKIKARPAKLKFKKVRKARKLKFKLTASEDVTNLAAAIQKGDKVIGSGKLAKLSKTGVLTIKLSSKLKKGAYSLVLTGRRPSGSTGTVVLKLRIR